MAASSQASNRGVPPRSTPGSPFSLKSSPNYRPAGYGSAGLTPPLEGGVGRARAPSFELPPPMQSLPGKSTPNINVIPEGEAQVRSYQASYTVWLISMMKEFCQVHSTPPHSITDIPQSEYEHIASHLWDQ